MNHCRDRHLPFNAMIKTIFQAAGLMGAANKFTMGLAIFLCICYSNDQFDPAIKDGYRTLEVMESRHPEEYPLAKEFLDHILEKYGNLETGVPDLALRMTEKVMKKVNAKNFMDQMIKRLDNGLVSSRFLVENVPDNNWDDWDTDDEDKDGVGPPALWWVQGVPLQHALILCVISKKCRESMKFTDEYKAKVLLNKVEQQMIQQSQPLFDS